MKLVRNRTSVLLRCAYTRGLYARVFAQLDGKLGGTVGDIESAPFVEAMRQFQFRVGHENFALIHVSLVPDMHGEQKTKPTQTTVHALRGLGLLPDLVCSYRLRHVAHILSIRTDARTWGRLRAGLLSHNHWQRRRKRKFRCSVMSRPSKSSACTMLHQCTMFPYCSSPRGLWASSSVGLTSPASSLRRKCSNMAHPWRADGRHSPRGRSQQRGVLKLIILPLPL
jgi:hypothetical protein